MSDGAPVSPLPARHRWLAISFYGGPDDEVLLELEGVGLLDTARTFTSGAALGAYLHDVLASLLGAPDTAADGVMATTAARPAHDRFIETIRGAIAHCAAGIAGGAHPGSADPTLPDEAPRGMS